MTQKHCPGKLLRSAFAGKQNDKPGYVVNDHLSSACRRRSGSSDLPESMTGKPYTLSIRSCFGWGLHMPSSVTRRAVVSYTALPPLPGKTWRYHFCCTILGVASAGRYPASCPAKPGLSSPGPFRSCQPRSHILLCQKRNIRQLNNLTTNSLSCPSPISQILQSHTKQPFHTSKAAAPDKLPQNRILRNILTRHSAENNPETSAAALPPGTPALPPQSGTAAVPHTASEPQSSYISAELNITSALLLVSEKYSDPRRGAPTATSQSSSFADVPRVRLSRTIRRSRRPSVVGIRLCSSTFRLRQRADINFEFALRMASDIRQSYHSSP